MRSSAYVMVRSVPAKPGRVSNHADLVFDGRPVTTAASRRNNEDRFVSTAEIDGKLYTVVWMWRGENHRIISFRRGGDGEVRAYRQIFG